MFDLNDSKLHERPSTENENYHVLSFIYRARHNFLNLSAHLMISVIFLRIIF